MTKISPLLSVLIATRNRQAYALSAVRSILSIADARLELVIQDNSDQPSLRDSLTEFDGDNRLVYNYTPPPFSSIDNFRTSIDKASGEYICLIGDDDGVNPEIISAAQWAKDNNQDALVGSLSANYIWPGAGIPDTAFTRMNGGTLLLGHIELTAKRINVENSVRQLVRNGCTYYLDYSLPKLYHGLVRRQLFSEIRHRTGQYIGGLSPDIYTSVALSLVVKSATYVDYPLTIPGVCSESTSVSEGQLRRTRPLEEAPHFRDRGPYVWSREVPRLYVVEGIWADSALAAFRDMGREDLLRDFNLHRLTAYIISANRGAFRVALKHMISYRRRFSYFHIISDCSRLMFEYVRGPIRRFLFRRALNRLSIICKLRSSDQIHNLDNMSSTMHALVNYLESRAISFELAIKNR